MIALFFLVWLKMCQHLLVVTGVSTMADQRLFPWERAELPEGVYLGEAPPGGWPPFTFADYLRAARRVLAEWRTDGEEDGYINYLLTEDYARDPGAPRKTAPKPLRRAMAMLYKDILPAEMWPGFLDRFRAEPLLVRDIVELERQRAWERRRHALLAWESNLS